MILLRIFKKYAFEKHLKITELGIQQQFSFKYLCGDDEVGTNIIKTILLFGCCRGGWAKQKLLL